MENKERITVNWKGIGAYVTGMAMSAFLMYNVSKPVCSVTVDDINKDGIEDVITYDSNHQILDTYLGVKDSSKTITYVEAEKLYEQKLDSLKNSRDQKFDDIMNQYDKEKQNLEQKLDSLENARNSKAKDVMTDYNNGKIELK